MSTTKPPITVDRDWTLALIAPLYEQLGINPKAVVCIQFASDCVTIECVLSPPGAGGEEFPPAVRVPDDVPNGEFVVATYKTRFYYDDEVTPDELRALTIEVREVCDEYHRIFPVPSSLPPNLTLATRALVLAERMRAEGVRPCGNPAGLSCDYDNGRAEGRVEGRNEVAASVDKACDVAQSTGVLSVHVDMIRAAISDVGVDARNRAVKAQGLREAADAVPLFEFMLVMDIASEVAPAQIGAWLRDRAEATESGEHDD